MSVRTDLAMEAKELVTEEISGVEEQQYQKQNMQITHVTIKDETAAQTLGKPIGKYVTIETKNMGNKDANNISEIAGVLAEELKQVYHVRNEDTILIIGLGNQAITPDSVGPKTVREVLVTRHLFEYVPDVMDERMCRVSAIAPGVLGTTGIETGEIVFGLVEKIKPNLVIAIDALVSLHAQRVAKTIQMTDTGIHPGSGVGNNRKALSKETLGVPVIAIGVPTILDTTGFFKENFSFFVDSLPQEIMSKKQKDNLMTRVSFWGDESFFVTPKDMDELSDTVSSILALGIDLWLHHEMTEEELLLYR